MSFELEVFTSAELRPLSDFIELVKNNLPGPDDRYANENGQVAVVYSPGYGAGWASWIDNLLPTHPIIAALIDLNRKSDITPELMEALGYPGAYIGGLSDAEIIWLEPGTPYILTEYDGFESIDLAPDNLYRA